MASCPVGIMVPKKPYGSSMSRAACACERAQQKAKNAKAMKANAAVRLPRMESVEPLLVRILAFPSVCRESVECTACRLRCRLGKPGLPCYRVTAAEMPSAARLYWLIQHRLPQTVAPRCCGERAAGGLRVRDGAPARLWLV